MFIGLSFVAMDDTSMNHYEKQLYTVFKTFDVDNEEALDRPAVLDLCNALQLEDRGAALVDTLFEKSTNRVTFSHFRNGLLSVLGGEGVESCHATQTNASVPSTHASSTFQTPHSDDDSSGREVAPKFVFGSKKYGRRSRPQRCASSSREPPSRSSSDSRVVNDGERLKQRMQCKRSASVMEKRPNETVITNDNLFTVNLDHDKHIDCEHALALCRNLHMDGIDKSVVEKIFENLQSKETTIGEFFDRLNSSLASSIAAARENEVDEFQKASDETDSQITSDIVVEAWEHAGLQQARHLLLGLGFEMPRLQTSALESALEDELRSLAVPLDQPTAVLLIAALALSRLQVKRTRQHVEIATAERDKLRADLAEANRRAQLLAQDVDESHAHIESELKNRLRMLEARHAEALRVVTAQHAEEREKAASIRSCLETDIERRNETETKLRADIIVLHERCEELERRVSLAEDQANSEHELVQSSVQTVEVEGYSDEVEGMEAAKKEFTLHINELRIENKLLRDRNDELCAELEVHARQAEASSTGITMDMSGASWRDEAASVHPRGSESSVEPSSLLSHNQLEECDSSLMSIDQKIYGHIEIYRRLQGILEQIQTAPAVKTSCKTCVVLKDIVTAIQDKITDLNKSVTLINQNGLRVESSADTSSQTDPPDIKEPPDSTDEQEVAASEQKHQDEKQRLSNLVKDLETSLDQLKLEYDRCEDYWQSKLDEEREIYNEEQKASDERLSELIGKIGEYERQFASSRLPAIDEAHELEDQVTVLEEELCVFRKEKGSELEKKDFEIAQLKERLEMREGQCACVSSERRAVRDYHNPAFMTSAPQAQSPPAPQRRTADTCTNSVTERTTDQHDAESQKPECVAGVVSGGGGGGSGSEACTCAALAARCRALWARGEAWRAAGVREAAELRARLAAAEGAVGRLHARLAAADLLVKDLYLENCHLAHAAPPTRRPL